MPSPDRVPIDQHNTEILANRQAWSRKPLLRELYRRFHEKIAASLTAGRGLTVELGSGIGSIKAVLPHCVTTDLFDNPWVDRKENAYALSFADRSVSNLILFDVWHHLEFPGSALAEFARVLEPGGRLVIFDPDMSALGLLVYGCFHHEPLGLREPVRWLAPAGVAPSALPYFAAQSRAHRMFVRNEWTGPVDAWKRLTVERISSVAYVASGGFSQPQLYPTRWLPAVARVDTWLSRWPALFATRLLVVLEKPA